MTQPPALSVAIPLFNKAGFIVETVRSALSQSFADFEIIVVDDGSTDDGVSKLRDIDDPRLTVTRQENSGVAVARNQAMQEARGRFVAFLDADDLWQPDHLLHLMRMSDRFPQAALFGNAFVEVVRNEPRRHSERPVQYRLVDDYFSECAEGRPPFFTSSCMVLRRCATESGGFPTPKAAGEDLALWTRMAAGAPVAASDYIGCVYRRTVDSLSSQAYRLAKDVSMSTLLEILDQHPDWPSERKSSAQEYYFRLALAHCLDCLKAGDVEAAKNFLQISSGTNAQRRRWWQARLLVSTPSAVRKLIFQLRDHLTH
jgi:glycosyltransferase involved in cell wall biosynthesis